MTIRPSFKKPKAAQTYDTVEELFSKLPNRNASHGYLRGPQVDALREYMRLEKNNSDLAFELPTGTGKTTVGLLIAEWRRRKSGNKVAFLSLTNQLAKQVLVEAQNLGIECADLTGNRETRDPAEEGRYLTGRAVGVSTYSNLFNVNPVIQASDIIVFDDSHGGARYAIDMWTVRINRRDSEELYEQALTALRPAIHDSQFRIITDDSEIGNVELLDVHRHSDVMRYVTGLFDRAGSAVSSVYFPWSLIRNKLHACLFFASYGEIVIRPIVPPTDTHTPFEESNQRIYMSATLEGIGDLERSYGVTGIKAIQARHAQWGKRYIFLPGLYVDEIETADLFAKIWEEMPIKRGLLLGPSFSTVDRYYSSLTSQMMSGPTKLNARNIEHSVEPFVGRDDQLLCLAGRYDGLDLPGDDCRLLILAETPAAIGAMERHLRSQWRLGPLLRRLERTRLIQGMGRCTRDATDFTIILFLGQSLLDSVTHSDLIDGLPEEIRKEIAWGIEQSEVAHNDVMALKEMIIGLLTDSDYRKDANELLEEKVLISGADALEEYEDSGKSEVKFSRALWAEDFSGAKAFACDVANIANHRKLSGYRAWWWFLAAHCSSMLEDSDSEIECLRRAAATGVNAGFLNKLLLKRKGIKQNLYKDVDGLDVQSQAVWRQIDKWGWQGPKFDAKLDEMLSALKNVTKANQFHIGVELLGNGLGAETIRPTNDGDPDVIWIFDGGFSYTFEAKSGKKGNGALSKRHVQQANGHPKWLTRERTDITEDCVKPLIIASSASLREDAKPHASGLHFVQLDELIAFSENTAKSLRAIRTEFAGKEFADVRADFKQTLVQEKITAVDVDNILTKVAFD